MNLLKTFAAILLPLLLAATGAHAQAVTSLWFQSDPTDPIGQGQTATFTAPADQIDIYNSGPDGLYLRAGDFQLFVSGPLQAPLALGAYEATAPSLDSGTSPGLQFNSPQSNCYEPWSGRFVVHEIARSGTGAFTNLALNFELRCGNATGSLYGELRINSAYPFTFNKPANSTQPDPFAFKPVGSAAPSTTYTSNSTTIYGINAPVSIFVSGGEYSVNEGPFTANPGTVVNRDRVRVRAQSSGTGGATATTFLTIAGSVTQTFTITTYLPGSQQNAFFVRSMPGAHIGNGQNHLGFAPDWYFTLYNSSPDASIEAVGPGGRRFSLRLKPPFQDVNTLQVGPYENAAGPWGTASPGVDLRIDGGCSNSYGRFVVLEAEFNSVPKRFAANVEQWCDNELAPTYAEVRFNSTIPLSPQVATDTVPDAFALQAPNPVKAGTLVYSNSIRIYGITASIPISIIGGEYSVNGGAYTAAPGTVANLDLVRVRVQASSTPGEQRAATLNANGQSATLTAISYAPGMVLTGAYMRSTPGDYIGQGGTYFHLAPPSRITTVNSFGGAELTLDAVFGDRWDFWFASSPGTPPAVGTYEQATRYPNYNGTGPQIGISGLGHGCDGTGRFVVRDAVYGPGNTIVRFAADFEQYCEGSSAPLVGEVRYNSTIPFTSLIADPPVAVPFDFNGDGKSDLVLRHTDGRIAMWLMNGAAISANQQILGAGSGFDVTHVSDTDGNAKGDLVFRHTDGRVVIYLMNGTTVAGGATLVGPGSGFTVTRMADFNGDGKDDILWTHTDGHVAIWFMNGVSVTGGGNVLGPASGFTATRTADFNGDGKDDILWTHTDGRVAIWLMNGLNVIGGGGILAPGSGFTAIHTADLNGDGKADIIWRHTDGRIAVWLMSGSSVIGGGTLFAGGTGWTVARTADFNGDGKADLLWTHTDGRAAIWLMNGFTATSVVQIMNAGGGWTPKRTGDLNGDGKADIVWENADGRVAVWLMNGTALIGGGTILNAGSGWSVSSSSQ